MIIPPYPFTLEDPPNVPLEDAWYARPQLFFTCWFRPMDGRPPSQGNYTIGPDDFEMQVHHATGVFLAHLKSCSCQQGAPWIMLQPSSMSRPRHRYCSWPPSTMFWGECPFSPCSWTATPLPRYHTICAISKPALFSMGPLIQPILKAGGEATLTR